MKKYAVFLILIGILVLMSGCETLTLVAWGNIAIDGTIRGSSGNFTVDNSTAGVYIIQWTDGTETNAINSIVDVQPIASANVSAVWTGAVDGNLGISMFDADSGVTGNAPFCFTVYQW